MADETPEKDGREAEPQDAELERAVAGAEPGADPQDELDAAAEQKPKRAPRRRKKADAEASVDAEAADAATSASDEADPGPAAEEKPKRARRPRRAATTAEAKADDGDAPEAKPEESKAEKPKTRSRRPSSASTPARRPRAAAAAGAGHGSRPVVRAQAKYVRTSARKARMVCGHIRGKSVAEARAILAFTPRQVARDWAKVLDSAVANAENNHELVEEDLIVREAYADEGPTIKRFRPRARGRASAIRKRTSHLTITLTPGD
jgi:ribosomal protein L22